MDEHLRRLRIANLEAAERSVICSGLPPRSPFAVAVGERYARQEISADEGISAIIAYHRSQVVAVARNAVKE